MSNYIMGLRQLVGSRPLIMPAASVIVIDKHQRILLQHRSDNRMWGLPGGSLELGESFEDAARREVLEETGLVAGELKFFCLNSGQDTFYQYPNGDQVYMAGVIYTCTDFTGDVVADDDESLAVQWFAHDELPANISPVIRPVIDAYLKRAPQAPV